MFKFLKSLKPGGGPSGTKSPAKPAPKTAKPQGSAPSSARPPSPMTPLSVGAQTPVKTPATQPAQCTPTRLDGDRPMTPERAALIKNALSVHRSQQDVFADLDEEARHKLVLMAMLSLLKEARKEK